MALTVPLVLGGAIVVLGGGAGLLSRCLRWRWAGRAGLALGVVVAVAGLVITAWAIVAAGGERGPRTLAPGPGIVYQRVAFDSPRPQVLHVAVVDLDEPCLRLDATRPGPDGTVTAETGTEFLSRTGAVLSINVAYFYPIREYPYWKAYPRSGDPVTAIGQVVIGGEVFGRPGDPPLDRTLTVVAGSQDGAASGPARMVLPAREVLVTGGRSVAPESTPYPRTVAGIDNDANRLVLLVVDGKQPGYAEGSTYAEVARFLVALGVDEAVELDGGGSATMVGLVGGEVELLSRPSQQRLPGRERPVATHLGVYVDPACR